MNPNHLILSLFGLIVFIQVCYYLFVFSGFSFSKKEKKKSISKNNLPVSIVICAKNEKENITDNIPIFLNQKYSSDFEVVLVNDTSYDGTLEVMEAIAEKHSNVKIVDVRDNNVNNNWSSKKYALMLGIKAATHNHLLFSDADCQPKSKNWITEMASQFTDKKSIVLGYGGYRTIKNSFINKIIRFETLLTALQYFSYAKRGNPYMGVGRNLAYTKDLFFENNGFANHMKILSGDDDLFVNSIATKKNTAVVSNPYSFTISEPKKTFFKWIQQKRRHISTAKYYKKKDKFFLALFYFSQLAFIISTIALLSLQFELIIVGSLIATRYLFSYLSIGFASKKLNEKGILLLYPLIELTLILSQLYIFATNSFIKTNHWR